MIFYKGFSVEVLLHTSVVCKISIIYPHFTDNENEGDKAACLRTSSNSFSRRLHTNCPYALSYKVLVRIKIFSFLGIT